MAQNVTLLGADYPDVPSVILPKTGGGNAIFTDVSGTTASATDVKNPKKFYLPDGSFETGSYVWDFKGDDATLLQTIYQTTATALSATSYATWTPSTTAKVIKAAATAGTFSADFSQYDYLIRWQFQFIAAYQEGATLKAAPIKEVIELWQALTRRPNSLSNIAAANFNSNACITFQTVPLIDYYNTSGTRAYAFTGSYGFYPSATTATFSSSTSNSPTVTVKTPAINSRCSTTYFSTTSAANIDQTNSIFKLRGDIFRTKTGAAERRLYEGLINLYNNPI